MKAPEGLARRVAAVTGAASGIGRAFCSRLAKDGHDLVLIDRSKDSTSAFANELRSSSPSIRIEECVADLTTPEGVDAAIHSLLQCGSNLQVLVNCAGFGTCGNFFEVNFDSQLAMIQLHVVATVRLCRTVLPSMVLHNQGSIINVASIAAFTRFPDNATYSATKMYLVAFSECLQAELSKVGAHDVRVQALCPGQTLTPFAETDAMRKWDPASVPSFMWMSPEKLVNMSLAAISRGSGTYIPTFKNRLFVAVFGNPVIIKTLSLLRRAGVLELFLKLVRGTNRQR